LARFPDGSGFGAERALALPILRRQLQSGGDDAAPKRIVIHAEAEAGTALAAELGDGIATEQQPLVDGLLPLFARSLRGHRPLSLLQGEFQARSDLQEHWRTWRVSAVLLAALLLLGTVQEIAAFVHLKRQAAALDSQVAALMSAAMPGGRVVAGAEQNQLKQLLSQLQGGSSAGNLLSLLEVLGNALAGNPTVQISALNFRGGNLQAQLQAGDVGSLDALKAALGQQPGLSVNLDSVSASGNQVSGRIVIGESRS
jgi:type II secretion system protein L